MVQFFISNDDVSAAVQRFPSILHQFKFPLKICKKKKRLENERDSST